MEDILQKLPIKEGHNLRYIMSLEELDRLFTHLFERHLEGESITSFERTYRISRSTTRRHFKRLGFKIENYQNKLRVRKDLFNKTENEFDAYWLGFIYADGYISDLGNLSIDLKDSDYKHLLKFASYAEFPKDSIRRNQKASFNSYRCRLSFSGKGSELNRLGVLPRKSLSLTFPKKDIVPKSLVRHFIRGYFDGDGCINFYKKNKKHNYFERAAKMLGTKSFLFQLKNICPISTNSFFKNKNLYVLGYNSLNCDQFLDWIYQDSLIYLDRKYEKYLALLDSNIKKESL